MLIWIVIEFTPVFFSQKYEFYHHCLLELYTNNNNGNVAANSYSSIEVSIFCLEMDFFPSYGINRWIDDDDRWEMMIDRW